MKNKVKEAIKMRIRRFEEGSMSWNELKAFYYEMQTLLRDMWRLDLMSDAVFNECGKELHNLSSYLTSNANRLDELNK